LVNVLNFIHLVSNPGLALGILGFVVKSAAPLVGQLGLETAAGFFTFFPTFLDLMGALMWSHMVTDF
jgi:hypothetical protein